MKNYLLHLACGLAGMGALLVSPAHAVIAGGMTANHYYYPASVTANADGLYGYSGIDASIRVTREPGNNGNTYYASQFFWTVNVNQGGYTGILQNAKKTKTVLFSIFGQTYARVSTSQAPPPVRYARDSAARARARNACSAHRAPRRRRGKRGSCTPST